MTTTPAGIVAGILLVTTAVGGVARMVKQSRADMTTADYVMRLAATTIAIVVTGSVFIMLTGLFDGRVDNKEIFKLLGPALYGALSAFTVILAYQFGRNDRSDK